MVLTFQNILKGTHQSVKQLESKSGPTFWSGCRSWLFAKVISRSQKVTANKKRVNFKFDGNVTNPTMVLRASKHVFIIGMCFQITIIIRNEISLEFPRL